MSVAPSGGGQDLPDLPTAANPRALYLAGAGVLALLAFTFFCHQQPALISHRVVLEGVHWLMVIGLVIAYLCGYRALQALPNASRSLPAVIGFAIAFSLVSLFIEPFQSIDVFCYINTGWLQFNYGLNPYVHVPADTTHWQHDPMLNAEWGFTPAAYGFLFSLLTRLLCWLGQGDLRTTLVLFKSLNVVVFGLTGWVLWLGCRRWQMPCPERALYLLLWNPLLLLHGIANGHNDLLMALFTMLALYLALRGTWVWVLPALMAGTLIKMGAALLLPFAFLFLLKGHGWKKATVSAGLALLLGVGCAAPYLTGDVGLAQLVRVAENATAMHNSLPSLIYFPFEVCARPFPFLKLHEDSIQATIKMLFWAGFLALVVPLAIVRLRGRRYAGAAFVRDCLFLQFVLICLVSSKYYAWYLGLFFPLGLWVSPSHWLRRTVIAVSCAQLLSFTGLGQAHGLNVLLMLLVPLAWGLRPRAFSLSCIRSFFPRSRFSRSGAASLQLLPLTKTPNQSLI